jgi:transcriptional regulator with XRE-family HTH domain
MKPEPLAAVIAGNVSRFRSEKQWTQQRLAEYAIRVGLSWSRVTVAEVEAGRRKVGLDEILVLALIFGRPLLTLISPEDFETEIELTPDVNLTREDLAAAVMFGASDESLPGLAEALRLDAEREELANDLRMAEVVQMEATAKMLRLQNQINLVSEKIEATGHTLFGSNPR